MRGGGASHVFGIQFRQLCTYNLKIANGKWKSRNDTRIVRLCPHSFKKLLTEAEVHLWPQFGGVGHLLARKKTQKKQTVLEVAHRKSKGCRQEVQMLPVCPLCTLTYLGDVGEVETTDMLGPFRKILCEGIHESFMSWDTRDTPAHTCGLSMYHTRLSRCALRTK